MKDVLFKPRYAIPGAVILMIIAAAVGLFLFTWSTSSAQSEWTNVNTLPKPTNLAATKDGATVHLSWDAPSGSLYHYQIERRRLTEGTTLEILVDMTESNVLTYTDESITEAGNYVYRVRVAAMNHKRGPRSGRATITITDADINPPPPEPTVSPAEAEVERLNRVVKEVAGGCLAFETGTTYDTNTDNADCVPFEDLIVDTCVSFADAPKIKGRFASIVVDSNGNTHLYSTLDKVTIKIGEVSWRDINSRDPSAINPETNYFFRTYPAEVNRVAYKWGRTAEQTELFEPESQVFSNSNHTTAIQGDTIRFLLQRMEDIQNGNDYRTPSTCAFRTGLDVRDNIQQIADSVLAIELTTGTATTGYLDNGPDLDLFQVELTDGTEYKVYAYPIPKEALDYDSVPIDNNFVAQQLNLDNRATNEDRLQAMGNVMPILNVLDSTGAVLMTTGADTPGSFTPSATGTYYLQVAHANEADYDNHGAYGVVAYTGNGPDLPATRLTHGRVYEDSTVSSDIGNNDDVDWLRFDADGHQLYSLRVHATDEDFQPVIEGIYNGDANDMPDAYETGGSANTVTADIYFAESGTYYIAVASDGSGSGNYTAAIHEDDHATDFETHITSTSGGDSVTLNGILSNKWDRDSFDIQIDHTAQNTFNADDLTEGVVHIRVSLSDPDPDNGPEVTELKVGNSLGSPVHTTIVEDPKWEDGGAVETNLSVVRVTVELDSNPQEREFPISLSAQLHQRLPPGRRRR